MPTWLPLALLPRLFALPCATRLVSQVVSRVLVLRSPVPPLVALLLPLPLRRLSLLEPVTDRFRTVLLRALLVLLALRKPDNRLDSRTVSKPDNRPDNRTASKPDSKTDSKLDNRPLELPQQTDSKPDSRFLVSLPPTDSRHRELPVPRLLV